MHSPDTYLWKTVFTCSGFLLIRILSTLLKKLASSGFRGDSFRRKLYNFNSKDSSSPSLSFIWETSEVSNSHDIFGYLEELNTALSSNSNSSSHQAQHTSRRFPKILSKHQNHLLGIKSTFKPFHSTS